MTCEHCGPLLSLYHDGMLEPTPREEMRIHLQSCAACMARLEGYRLVDRQVADALRLRPSVRFTHAVLAATREAEQAMAGAARRRRAARRRAQMALGGITGASAAGLIALALGVVAHLAPARVAHPGVVAQLVQASRPATTESPLRRPAPGASPASRGMTTIGTLARATHDMERPLPTRPAFAEATIAARTTHVDPAAQLRITGGVRLTAQKIEVPLWSGDSRSLLYLVDAYTDPRTTWQVGTLMRYGPSGTIRIDSAVGDYAWSPDSRAIIYTAQAPDAGAGSTLAEELHIVGADGSHDHVLCRVDRASVEYLTGHITAVRRGRLVAVNPATGASVPLRDMPALSIASEQSAFWALSAGERFFAYQDTSGLRVWDLARGGRLLLQDARASFAYASFHFSWDGNEIFYSTFDGHHTMLYRRSLDPLGAAQALNDGRPLRGPIVQVGSPSPGGTMLNFRAGQGNMTISYVIDTGHGRAHPLLPPNGAGVGPVGSWSPDGTRFVYTVYRGQQALESAIARVTR